MEEEGGPLAGLSAGAMKLLLALLLRGGQWASNADMMQESGLPKRTYYRAKAEVETVPLAPLVAQLRATYGTASGTPGTTPVPTLARPQLLRNEDATPQFGGVEDGEEFAQGFYSGRQPKTAQDEEAIRRMEALQARILAQKGRITW